jgi:NADH:ubiquinone oxidoreductase subunit 6 (subunit J)
MFKSKYIGWLLLTSIILSGVFLKGDYQFYTMLIVVILILPIFIYRLIKTFKENPDEKNSMLINLLLVIVFLIVGYLIITEKFKV